MNGDPISPTAKVSPLGEKAGEYEPVGSVAGLEYFVPKPEPFQG